MEVKRADRVAYRAYATATGGVLLDLETSLYFGINAVGALIWESIGTRVRIDDLVSALRNKLDRAPSNLADDVLEFITTLEERGLVVIERAQPE